MDAKCVISDHDYCEVKTRQKIIFRKKIKSSDVTLRVGVPVSETVHTYLTIGYEDSESNNVKLKQFVVKDKETSESNRENEIISSEVREIYQSSTTTTTSNASHEDNDVVPDDDHDYAPKRIIDIREVKHSKEFIENLTKSISLSDEESNSHEIDNEFEIASDALEIDNESEIASDNQEEDNNEEIESEDELDNNREIESETEEALILGSDIEVDNNEIKHDLVENNDLISTATTDELETGEINLKDITDKSNKEKVTKTVKEAIKLNQYKYKIISDTHSNETFDEHDYVKVKPVKRVISDNKTKTKENVSNENKENLPNCDKENLAILTEDLGEEHFQNEFLRFLDTDDLIQEGSSDHSNRTNYFDLILRTETCESTTPVIKFSDINIKYKNLSNQTSENNEKITDKEALNDITYIFNNSITSLKLDEDDSIEKHIYNFKKLDNMERTLQGLKYDQEFIKTINKKKSPPKVVEKIVPEKKFKCSQCTMSFDRVPEWVQHFNSHVVTQVFKCIPCQLSFSSLESYRNHLIKYHPETNKKITTTAAQKTYTSKEKETKISDISLDNLEFDDEETFENDIADTESDAVKEAVERNHALRPTIVCEKCSVEYISTLVQAQHISHHMMNDIEELNNYDPCRTCEMLNMKNLRIIDAESDNYYFTCYKCYQSLEEIRVESYDNETNDLDVIKVGVDGNTDGNTTNALGELIRNIFDDELSISSLSSLSDDFSDSCIHSQDVILLSDDEQMDETLNLDDDSLPCDNHNYDDNISLNDVTDQIDFINCDLENVIEIKEVTGCNIREKRKRSCAKYNRQDTAFNTTKYPYPVFTVQNFDEFSSENESDDSFNFECDVQIDYIKNDDL